MPLTAYGARAFLRGEWSHLSLHTGAVATQDNELTGNGYARSPAVWTHSAGTYTVAPAFPAASGGAWDTALSVAVRASAQAGARILAYATFSPGVTTADGSTPTIPATALEFSVTADGFTPEGLAVLYGMGFADDTYLALHTGAPTAANELFGGGYARDPMTLTAPATIEVTGTTGALVQNNQQINFATPTADWDVPTHVAIWSAASGGNLLWSTALAGTSPTPTATAGVSFAVGALKIDFSSESFLALSEDTPLRVDDDTLAWRFASTEPRDRAPSRRSAAAAIADAHAAAGSSVPGTGGATDLGVTRTADNVVVTSSTGTDATLPAASVTEAGVMTASDKNAVSRSLTAAAAVNAGEFIAGSSDGTRNVRAATAGDLTALATALAADARGASELALKSELGSGGGGGGGGIEMPVTLVDDVAMTLINVSIGGGGSGHRALAVTLSAPLMSGRILVFHLSKGGTGAMSTQTAPSVAVCITNEILNLPVQDTVPSTDPEDPGSHAALRFIIPRVNDNYGFRQDVLSVWRHSSNEALWVAGVRDEEYRLSLFEYPIGGGGLNVAAVDGRIASWARDANTDDIPGAKLADAGVAVIANAQASLANFNVGSLVYNLADQHFYRVLEDRTHANYALRITFAPDEISTDAIDFWSQGYAREAVAPYAEAAHGTLGNIPNVQATVPGTLDALIAVTEDDRSAGTVLIGIDSTSAFVPDRMRWRVGSTRGDKRVGFDGGVVSGVHRYFLSSSFDRSIGNPFRIAEGQSEDQTVDFDITDAAGVSIAPATTARRYLQRIDLPGTVTAFTGNVSVPYGRHEAPQPQSGILIDSQTGDEYYARRSTDPDLVVVEPVEAGSGAYGLAPGNEASFNKPAALSRLSWDPVTGLVDVEGSVSDLNRWKKVSHVADPAEGGSGTRTARLVEVPASTTTLGNRRKRALMCDWHSSLQRMPVIVGSQGPLLSISGISEFVRYRTSSRKLEMRLRGGRMNDDGQVAMMQRVTFEAHGTGDSVWRVGIPESANNSGVVPQSGVWGELGGGLHPVWFEIVLRLWSETTPLQNASHADQISGSHVHTGYRVQSGETLWLIIRLSNEADGAPDQTTETFEPAPDAALSTAIKLSYVSSPVATGTVQRHSYAIASDTDQSTSSGFPADLLEQGQVASAHYVGLVVSDANSAANFTRSLEPVNFDTVEIEGVPIPMKLTERRMVVPSGETLGETTDSILEADWESEAYDTGQEAPLLAAGQSYALNYSNERGVRGRPYVSNTHPPSKHAASAFQLLDSSDAAETTTDGARAWWEVRSRGLPRINAPPQEQGAPWRLRRWGDEEHRAVPEQTANDVQGYVMNDPDVSGGFLVTGWSRTVMHQLADGNGSVVLERFEISSVSGGSRFLRIYVATGGSMPSVNMRIENHTQKWIHLTGNVSTTHHNYWQVQILTQGLPIAVGDEIRLRLWAGTHTPIAWNHAVTSWRPI